MEHEHFKHFIDAISIGGVVATFVGWLPSVAALFSIIWSILRIYETKTIQGWLNK